MRIIFVGVHNKPQFMPLDPKSKSGALIQRVIDKIDTSQGFEIIRTNLFDVDYLPISDFEIGQLCADFRHRINFNHKTDIVIGLGAIVHQWLRETIGTEFIKMRHPSGVWSHENKDLFVKKCIEKIQLKYFVLRETTLIGA